eukprot:TRINITY_DN14952_c0_g1_i2.p1 TRINITY_DN14952_c0_g1~~TRINITY_DN14952_c0_g1_i2.p1  ORF type:complete len:266 (-),score=39.76 TRINITY_DN14952_c0_g1_i2:18-707(-)
MFAGLDPYFQYQFLTMLNHIAQTIFFLVAALSDVIPWRPLRRFTTYAYTILLPIASIVGILFWSIYLYDQDLMIPKERNFDYPMALNKFQHGYVSLLMWMELFLRAVRRASPAHARDDDIVPPLRVQMTSTAIVAILYIGWMHVTKVWAGGFPYPFLNLLDDWGRMGFFAGSVLLVWCVVFLGDRSSNQIARMLGAKERHLPGLTPPAAGQHQKPKISQKKDNQENKLD